MSVRVILACPNCGHTEFAYKDVDFECLNCGEWTDTSEMVSEVLEAHELSSVGLVEQSELKALAKLQKAVNGI